MAVWKNYKEDSFGGEMLDNYGLKWCGYKIV